VRLLLECAEQSKSPQMALMLRLLVQLGLRKGEALGLWWEDVDLENRTLRIQRQFSLQGCRAGLGGLKSRAAYQTVPLPADLASRLAA